MKKSINPQAIEIQKRFFQALELAIDSGKINGIKGFCDNHKLNRIKYQNIKMSLQKPLEESTYKCIDIDALQYLCNDFNVSCEWLVFGRGQMLKGK